MRQPITFTYSRDVMAEANFFFIYRRLPGTFFFRAWRHRWQAQCGFMGGVRRVSPSIQHDHDIAFSLNYAGRIRDTSVSLGLRLF